MICSSLQLIKVDADGLDLEPDDAVVDVVVGVVGEDEPEVVVDEGSVVVDVAQFVPPLVNLLMGVHHLELGGAGEVVHQQVDVVLVSDAIDDFLRLLLTPDDGFGEVVAEQLAGHRHVHVHLIGRVDDPVAPKHLAQVLRLVQGAVPGPAELQGVIVVGQLRLRTCHFDSLDFDGRVLRKLDGGHAGDVEPEGSLR